MAQANPDGATPNDQFSTEAQKQRESGIDVRYLPPPGVQPPLGGHFAVQHYKSFSGTQNMASRTYRFTFDEALRDSQCNANAMRHDPVIRKAIDKRVRPVVQLEWQVDPVNPSDPQQVDAAYAITRILEEVPRLQQMKRSLLGEGMFYGRAGVQTLFHNKIIDGVPRVAVSQWLPVNGDKIVFKWDGTPGILVSSSQYRGPWEPTDRGAAHFMTLEELECFYHYEFEPIDADFFESELAGSVHGVGFRGKLYYYWWLKTNLQSQMLDFLQKIGQGFTIFYYEQSNPESQKEVMNAAVSQIGNNVYLFPRNRDRQSAYSGSGIEHIPVPMQGTNFFQQMIEYYDDIMTDYILGEALTTSTAATGLGSGVAQAHEDTADDRVKYDANDLDGVMQRLTATLYRWNFPGIPCGHYRSLVDKRNPGEYMESASFAYELGVDIDEDELREVLALPRPQPGHAVLSKMNSLDPAAMGMVPQGMPMAGQPGPEQLDQHGRPMPQPQQGQEMGQQQGQQVVQGVPVG